MALYHEKSKVVRLRRITGEGINGLHDCLENLLCAGFWLGCHNRPQPVFAEHLFVGVYGLGHAVSIEDQKITEGHANLTLLQIEIVEDAQNDTTRGQLPQLTCGHLKPERRVVTGIGIS